MNVLRNSAAVRPHGRLCLVLVAGALLLAGCSDGPARPPEPQPGVLTIVLEGATGSEAAVIVALDGPDAISRVEAASGELRHHARSEGNHTRVAVFGTLESGTLLRIWVPDVQQANRYSASVLEVAGSDHRLIAVDGYRLQVRRP
jgi:hypothetical protein